MLHSRTRHAERGQTLPVWVVSVIMALSLTFFVFNYANTVRWQIRAQNAADSAAIAVVGSDAAAANSVTTLLYALSIQELRLRSIDQAVKNLLTDGSCGLVSVNCLGNYTALVGKYTTAAANYQTIVNQLSTFSGNLSGTLASPGTTVNSLYGNNCLKLSTDCSFKYTTKVTAAVPIVVDEFACRKVDSVAAQFTHLTNSSFLALGRATMTLAPLTQSFSPTAVQQPVENLLNSTQLATLTSTSASSYQVDFSGLSANIGFLVPVPTAPVAGNNPGNASAVC